MRIESLQYFVVTADCKSMTLSGTLLHISQQCISREIKQLEQELGAQLFVRSKQGVTLTEDGQKAYHTALLILKQFDGFSKMFQQRSFSQVNLAIGSYSGFKPHLDSILKIYQKKHFDISVYEYNSSTEQLAHALHNGTIDIALRQLEKHFLEELDTSKQYQHFILLTEPVQALINATSHNATISCIQMEKIDQFRIEFYCDTTDEIPLYQRIVQRYATDLNILYKGNNTEKAWDLFVQNNSIAIMTKSLAHFVLDALPMRLVPINKDIAICTVLSVKSDLLVQPYVQDLIEVFKVFFAQYASDG